MQALYKDIEAKIIDFIKSINNSTNKLPTEREFCTIFNVSRQTIRKALYECEKKGLIEKRQGSGIYLSRSYLQSKNQVALIIPNKDESFYPSLIIELESRMNSITYSLTVYETHNYLKNEKQILENIINNPVSTLIIVNERNILPSPFVDKYRSISQQGTNIIFIGNPNPNITDCSYIKFDDFYSGYSVAKRIDSKEKNWCAIFVNDNRGSMDRYYGFIQCMEENDYEYDETNIYWISQKDISDMRKKNISCIRNILKNYNTTPSVIICGQEDISYSTVIHLKNTRQLSEDTHIFSFEDHSTKRIASNVVRSYNGNTGLLYTKIVELTLKGAKKEKEVITLPSLLES